MRKNLKVDFCDFWAYFDKTDNFFFKSLSKKYNLLISDDPDILIYSCFGNDHLKYKCVKIFYTGENKVSDFYACDYSISFEDNNNPRQFKLPYYAFRLLELDSINELLKPKTHEEASLIWKNKSKFSSFVISNAKAKERISFFEKLSLYKRVESGGRYLNNVGGPIKDKIQFISQYKFNIAFENERFPGYLTEKIVDAFLANTIPIYWGDPLISKVFNENKFINVSHYSSYEEVIEKIKIIENDEALAINMLCEPVFENVLPNELNLSKFENFLFGIIENKNEIKPVSRTWRRYVCIFKYGKKTFEKNVKRLIMKTTRFLKFLIF